MRLKSALVVHEYNSRGSASPTPRSASRCDQILSIPLCKSALHLRRFAVVGRNHLAGKRARSAPRYLKHSQEMSNRPRQRPSAARFSRRYSASSQDREGVTNFHRPLRVPFPARTLVPVPDFVDADRVMSGWTADRSVDSQMSGAPDIWPLSAREAAEVLGVNERTVRRAIQRGELAATKQAGVYRIASAALERYRARLAGTHGGEDTAPMEHVPPLPAQLSQFVGREREIAAASALLRRDDVRLVTLTGPGGVGKTRLALQIGEETREAFDAVCFVPLAAVRDAKLVVPTVAHRLGLRDADQEPLNERLLRSLCRCRRLLILDNFEHVLEAAPLVVHLLDACPSLKVMVTSRTVLHVTGEHAFPVPPLAVPPPTPLLSAEELPDYTAVRLFVERARAARPSFSLTDDNGRAISELCRRLEGLPLGLELGAAWLRLLSPDALLGQIKRRLPLLAGGPGDQPERLRTMRGAIAWSYDLLTPDEQLLFRRFAVFTGGVTLEAAGTVAGDGAPTADVLSGLASLVDASLLQPESAAGDHPGSSCWRRSASTDWSAWRPAVRRQGSAGAMPPGASSWQSGQIRSCSDPTRHVGWPN